MRSYNRHVVSSVIIGIFLIFSPLGVYAKSGCCSHHGGENGCNNATGYMSCKDGTTSPSCTCDGGSNKTKSSKTTSSKATQPASTTTAAPTAATTTKSKSSTKGCCAKHGGVDKCDSKTGHQICKDGTQSASCTC